MRAAIILLLCVAPLASADVREVARLAGDVLSVYPDAAYEKVVLVGDTWKCRQTRAGIECKPGASK
jgi:hypothetical protein